jgi:membrane carboxypeptidase/penicillin-binding protein
MSRSSAYVLTSMLESVVNEGTATVIRSLGFSGPAGGKTGTTDDYTDAWFIGFTPSLCCGVWVGYDRNRTIFRGATGGGIAAPIWGTFMKEVKPPDNARTRFRVPPGIVTAPICEQTGQLATPRCPRVRYEVFINETQPADPCSMHGPEAPPPPLPDSFEPVVPPTPGP